MPRHALPQLMTFAQVRDETGLPDNAVRTLLRRVPRVPGPGRSILVRRADVEAAIAGDLNPAPDAPGRLVGRQ